MVCCSLSVVWYSLLFVVDCFVVARRCLLFVVRCAKFVVCCCWLGVGRRRCSCYWQCSLFACCCCVMILVCCALFVVCCSSVSVVCWLLYVGVFGFVYR